MRRVVVLKVVVAFPLWLFGSAMFWMLVGFGVPGVSEYSETQWKFINYGLPVILLLAYLPMAWWIVRREDA